MKKNFFSFALLLCFFLVVLSFQIMIDGIQMPNKTDWAKARKLFKAIGIDFCLKRT